MESFFSLLWKNVSTLGAGTTGKDCAAANTLHPGLNPEEPVSSAGSRDRTGQA